LEESTKPPEKQNLKPEINNFGYVRKFPESELILVHVGISGLSLVIYGALLHYGPEPRLVFRHFSYFVHL
jgi:hypothetical protein